MTAATDPQIVPRPPWSRSSPTTPGASTAPSGSSSPIGAPRWACTPCRPKPLTVARYLAVRAAVMAPPSPPCAWRLRHRQGP